MGFTIGIDEVGRGCWAGPLVACAAVLHRPVPGLKDSKLLTTTQRINLIDELRQSTYYGLGWVHPSEIDILGLTEAVRLGMVRALTSLQQQLNDLGEEYQQIIIDGNYNYLSHIPLTKNIIKADNLVPAVSAASVIAKVARDNYMVKLAERLPEYGFDRHVGYGTKVHRRALERYGVSSHHRKSYKPIQAFL